MDLKTNFPLLAAAALGLAFAAPLARANQVNLAFFGPTPETVTFNGGLEGQAVFADGAVTITGGRINVTGYGPLHMPTPNYTNDGGGNTPVGGVLRIDFAAPVSAVGMDVYYNYDSVRLRLFDSSDNQLDVVSDFPTEYSGIGGFIGSDVGSSLVSYALIDVPDASGHDLYIDNIVYQYQSVPDEANIVGLLGMALVGIALFRRKFPATSA